MGMIPNYAFAEALISEKTRKLHLEAIFGNYPYLDYYYFYNLYYYSLS